MASLEKEVRERALSLTCIYKIVRCLKKSGYRGYSMEDFADLLPTTQSLRMRNSIDEQYFLKINRQYWKRIVQGNRSIGDPGLIKRIENGTGVRIGINDNPFFWLLMNNNLNEKKLLIILEKINVNLDGRIFHFKNNEITENPIYWSEKNIDLISDENFLAYQLLLLNRNWKNKNIRRPCIKGAVLLFWRILIRIPMHRFSEPLCEIFYNYLITNLGINRSTFDENSNSFVKLRQIAFPDISKYPEYTNSFESYKNYHQSLYEKYSATIKHDFFDYLEVNRSPIIYWADRYADRWMCCDINKADLFDQSSPYFSDIYKGVRCFTRHRIW